MNHPDHLTTSRAYPFGNGFDFVMATPDYRAFRTWWNEHSFFPVSADETGAPMSQTEYRDAA